MEEPRTLPQLLERAVAERSVFDMRNLDLAAFELPELRTDRLPEGAVLLDLRSKAAFDTWFFHDDFVFLERSAVATPADALALFSLENNQRGLEETSHAYRPLSTNLYFASVQHAFGMNARAFHVANLLALAALAHGKP